MDHPQDEDVVHPYDIEHAIGEALEIGSTDLFVNDRERRGMSTDLDDGAIQVIPERKVQTRPLPGVPLLRREEIPLGS